MRRSISESDSKLAKVRASKAAPGRCRLPEMDFRVRHLLLPILICASACHPDQSQPLTHPDQAQAAPAASAGAALTPVPPVVLAKVAALNQAALPAAGPAAAPAAFAHDAKHVPGAGVQAAPDPLIVRAEVLLARARFSPGVVDGQFGTNFQHAVAAYQSARGLKDDGVDAHAVMAPATWAALLAEPQSASPAASAYVITPADIAGPFAPDVGEDFVKLAAQPGGPQFATVIEALGERFHMSQALLRALNPGVTFAAAGQAIVVVDANPAPFAKGDVARIDVSKADASAQAFDAAGKLIAFYPATVGSTERPSPSGTHKVVGVANHPVYVYDPSKLKWGPRAAGKLVIKYGPNNPVGMVWIDLNAPSYGIHGTPDPDNIGKTASHGCVRLTNWDAMALAAGVTPGVVVQFIGQRGGHPS